jgi:antitoxin component YwqK of YwqJK toxin-antitoxin module
MNLKILLVFFITLLPLISLAQTNDGINKTDSRGMKQGHWIKKYPDGHIQYDGYFKDNKPTGTFKRYYENDTINSILVFSADGREAVASLFHHNGYIASTGKYVDQLKEGKWRFYSSNIRGYLVCEEEYKANLRHGLSLKYYKDTLLAEKVQYINDLREGEWTQYFPNGKICLKANYINGKLQAGFSVYFSNGQPEYIGQYKNDTRDGLWKIFNPDGSLKYSIKYVEGIAEDSEKFKRESDYLDALEKNKGKIADPAITGTILE